MAVMRFSLSIPQVRQAASYRLIYSTRRFAVGSDSVSPVNALLPVRQVLQFMNVTVSLYLDLVRAVAALMVFLYHANYLRFSGGLPFARILSQAGNDAVMVFFVLSGFVIAYVAAEREHTMREYATSRLARLYSVMVPALLVTVAFDQIGARIAPALYAGWWYQSDQPIWRFLANLLFVNELWFTSTRPFSNGPFWSVGYEFWYYVLFGFAFYLRTKWRYVLIVGVMAFIGPKILVLLPVWLLGLAVYRFTSLHHFSEKIGWFFWLGSMVAFVLYRGGGGQEYLAGITIYFLGGEVFANLRWSQFFLSSYVIGLCVALNFIGFTAVSHRIEPILTHFQRPIRYMASLSFALYLVHYPALQLCAAILHEVPHGALRTAAVLLGPLFAVWALGGVSERRKGTYKRYFVTLWDQVQTRIRPL